MFLIYPHGWYVYHWWWIWASVKPLLHMGVPPRYQLYWKANEEYLIRNICQNCLNKCFLVFWQISKFPKYKQFFGSILVNGVGPVFLCSGWSVSSIVNSEMTIPVGQMLPYRLEGVNHHLGVSVPSSHHARSISTCQNVCQCTRTIPDHSGPSLRFLELFVPPKSSGGEVSMPLCQMAQNFVMMVVNFLPFMWWLQGCG